MSADELKQRGNEAFKRNDFKLACELFTEAIGLDSTNHVLYSNRSAARVSNTTCCCVFFFVCVYTVVCVHFRSVFRSSSSVCLRRRYYFFSGKNEEVVVFARPPNAREVVALALALVLVHHQNRVCFCSRSQQRNA